MATTPTLAHLWQELQDPRYDEARTNGATGDLLRMLTVDTPETGTKPVAIGDVFAYVDSQMNAAGNYPLWAAIKGVATGPVPDASDAAARGLYGAAVMAVELRNAPNRKETRVTEPAFQFLMGALVSAGLMTQAQSDAVLALADTPISRAEKLWGKDARITEEQIAAVLGMASAEG
jgi:hypothetical protein